MRQPLDDQRRHLVAQQDDRFDRQEIAATEYLQRVMHKLARRINEEIPANCGFMLTLFRFTGPELLYVSNAVREDVITLLKRLVSDIEKNESQVSR